MIQKVVKRIFEFCHERSIQLWIEWIPRKNNVLANALSKFYAVMIGCSTGYASRSWISCGDLTPLTGLPNRHCMQFNSRLWCPDSAGVNALTYDWLGENNWVNPPFALIGKCCFT